MKYDQRTGIEIPENKSEINELNKKHEYNLWEHFDFYVPMTPLFAVILSLIIYILIG